MVSVSEGKISNSFTGPTESLCHPTYCTSSYCLPTCQAHLMATRPRQPCSDLLGLCILCSHCLQHRSLSSLPTEMSRPAGAMPSPGKLGQGVSLPLCSQRGWCTPISILQHLPCGPEVSSAIDLFPHQLDFSKHLLGHLC